MQYRRFCLGFLLPVACFATSILRISFEQTIAQADSIVEGDVVRNWCDWDKAHRYVWTHTQITVRGRWKGSGGSTVTVSEPGGTVGNLNVDVPGMVRYTPGEHVVVFLYRTPIGFIRTVGLAQGKLQVDGGGHVHSVRPDGTLIRAAGTAPSGTSIADLESAPLAAVRDRVMRLAAAPREILK
jgi:hypothetical protein